MEQRNQRSAGLDLHSRIELLEANCTMAGLKTKRVQRNLDVCSGWDEWGGGLFSTAA